MVTLQKSNWKHFWNGWDSLNRSEEVLYSYTKKISEVNPLQFFYNGSANFKGQRFFWTNRARNEMIVGLGITLQFSSNENGKDRYLEIEKRWKQIVTNSFCHSPNSQIGPYMFGGFSFDPKRERTPLWEKFAHTEFVLPTVMLTIKDDEAFLTYNFFRNTSKEKVDQILLLEEALLKANTHSYSSAKLSSFLEMDPIEWKQSIEEVKRRIVAGQMDKVVLARELRTKFNDSLKIESVLGILLEEQPSCYIFAFEREDNCFIGASPEQLVQKESEIVKSMCLAGSIARGKTIAEDESLGDTLLSDSKNLQEHDFVVQMIGNSLRAVCQQITTGERPELYKLKHIQHLFTPVVGQLKDDVSIFQLIERLHPTPALGGYPKEISLETIREVELLDRGWYAGPIGWMNFNGDGEFAVAIRSALLQEKEASLFAGCGIVENSDPESEYEETRIKFKPMLSALGGIRHHDSNE